MIYIEPVSSLFWRCKFSNLLKMALLSFLVLLSVVRPIVAPPSMLLPNSTTVSASWVGASNKSALALAHTVTSLSPDQLEIEDFGSLFRDMNRSLSSFCLTVYESAYFSWKATNTQTTSFATCRQKETGSVCNNDGTYIETYPPHYRPRISPPCCGQCVITARKAYALFWPTPAPQPQISTLVGADGFIYTSPSVYIMFDHLGATDFCGNPGSVMPNATVPLQPWQVSSVGPNEWSGVETTVNFADLTNCSMNATISQTNADGGSYDPCHPSLQYDISYLSTIQPAWATCVDVGGVLWDPPSALTSITSVNGFDPHIPIPTLASSSLTNPASPGAHLPPAPPMTDPPTPPSMPKQTPVDPPGQASPTDHSHDTPSDPTIQSPADPPNAADPTTKPSNTAEAGQVANGPVSGPHNAATKSMTQKSEDPSVATAKNPDPFVASNPNASQANSPSKDPIKDPSDPGAPSSPRPLVVGHKTITVPNSGATALKIGSQTLNAQTPILTISNTPISLASDKVLIGTSAYPFMSPTLTPAENVFTIGQEPITLNSQGITVDRTQIRIGGPAVTVDGTGISLGPSELVVGGNTEKFTPATSDPLVEVSGERGAVGTGSGGNAATAAGPDAAIGSALMSSLGAIGGGAAAPSNVSKPGGNHSAAAPFLGTASKFGDGVNLWARVGLGFWVVGCLIM